MTEFLNNYTTVYGESLSYVVHTLLHFKRYVEIYGPMCSFSAYKFENHLPTIRDLVHEPTRVLAQIRNSGKKWERGHRQETRARFLSTLKASATTRSETHLTKSKKKATHENGHLNYPLNNFKQFQRINGYLQLFSSSSAKKTSKPF